MANKHEKIEEKRDKLLDNINRVELFYRVYGQIECLSLKKLKILKEFCHSLYNPYDLTIPRDKKIETENDIYRKYKEVLGEVIEGFVKRR